MNPILPTRLFTAVRGGRPALPDAIPARPRNPKPAAQVSPNRGKAA